MTSNHARKAITNFGGEGLPYSMMVSLRSDVQWLRDKWDAELLGTAEERLLLNDLSATLTAVIAWRP